MNKNIFFPSFKFEKKTKAFNKSIWGFVGLISLFSVGGACTIIHLMLCSIFDIESTFISDNLVCFVGLIVIFFALMFGIGIYNFFNSLLHSYKIEDKKIIKGRIISDADIQNNNLIFDAAVTTHMVSNITNSNAVVAGNAAKNVSNILSLINLNTNPEFVYNNFDSNVYKKKIYNNPQLLKETKYSLVYVCEGNKKLVIPKLYEGMNIKRINNESSLMARILIRSLIVFGIFLTFSIIDLSIGINNNPKYISNINNTCEAIQINLSNYGYSKEIDCYFKKRVSSDKTSTIAYNIDKYGNITNVSIDLYYNSYSYSEDELKYIISTLNKDYSNNKINSFIERVNSCVNGNCSFDIMSSQENILRIDLSSGFINLLK